VVADVAVEVGVAGCKADRVGGQPLAKTRIEPAVPVIRQSRVRIKILARVGEIDRDRRIGLADQVSERVVNPVVGDAE